MHPFRNKMYVFSQVEHVHDEGKRKRALEEILKAREYSTVLPLTAPQTSATQRKPMFPLELSGVLELRAATR
jgi:hypothetical protein